MSNISVDFDGTLRSYDGEPIVKIIKLVKEDIANGDNVVVITRRPKDETHNGLNGLGVIQWVKDNVGDIPVFFTNGIPKYKMLLRKNIDIHYDDDQYEIRLVKENTKVQVIEVNYDKSSKRESAMEYHKLTRENKIYHDKVACIIDHGLFVSMANKLGESFGNTFYFSPWQSSFPTSNDTLVGTGFSNFKRLNDLFDYIDDIDIFIFTDIYHSDLQCYLKSLGKRVWGTFGGDSMEIYRWDFIQTLKSLGLNTPPTVLIVGISKLKEYLQSVENKFIKVDSIYRGDIESFHHINYDISKPLLDKIEYKTGPNGECIRFIVQDGIDAIVETGYDGWVIDGMFPDECLVGIEEKDKGYIGEVRKYSDINKQVREINDALIPLFKEYGYRGMFSTEVRITSDGKAYLIDPTTRNPSPPTSTMLELIENISEIIWEGSNGLMVQPKFSNRFGGEIIGTSDFARENFMQIHCEESGGIYAPNSCIIDNKLYVVPPKYEDMNICCNIACGGSSIEDVVKNLEDKCYNIHGIGLTLDVSVLDKAIEGMSNI